MKKRVLLFVCILMAIVMPAAQWMEAPAAADVTPAVVLLDSEREIIDLSEGKTLRLSAVVLPNGASQRLRWSSSNTSVVKVNCRR